MNAIPPRLAELWTQTVGGDLPQPDTDLFSPGGDEAAALALVRRIRAAFDVHIDLAEWLDRPTCGYLAELISRCAPTSAEPASSTAVTQQHLDRPVPLTAAQRAAWLGRLPAFELGNVNPSWYLEFDLTDLDLARYTDAWRQLIDRHAALRTVVTDDGNQRVLADPPPYEIAVHDLQGLPPSEQTQRLAAARARLLDSILDPHQWPLFQVVAARLDDRRTRLHVLIDQFIADRNSLQILARDLAGYYHGRAPDPGVDSFAEAVVSLDAERTPALRDQARRYWQDRVAILPPAPQPPLTADPQTLGQPRYTRRRRTLPTVQWQQLRRHAAQAGLTPSAVLHTAFGETLAGWCKETHFTILVRRESRPPLSGVNDVVGDFSALTPTEIQADPRLPFRQRADTIQRQTWQDLDHRHVDGVDVLDELRRTTGQPTAAAIPVVHGVRLRSRATPDDRPGWTLGLGDVTDERSQTPRIWLSHDACDETGPLVLTYDSVDDLFPPGLLDDLCAHHLQLLRRLSAEPAGWDEPASECLPAPQRAVRARVNATTVAVPELLLHEPFWTQSRRTPDAPAVIATDRTLTYRQLRTGAAAIAERLLAVGTQPNQMVAIVMEKGWHQPVAVFGVLDAGAAYVPVEPDLPPERFQYLLEHAQVRTALVQPHLLHTLPWPAGVQPISVDDALLDGPDQPHPRRRQEPRDLAYIIYTSGSTGLPKGVMIEHRSALNTVLDINRRFTVIADDRMLALTPLSFDLSVYDLFGPFAVGGALVMPGAGTGRAPWHWAELLQQHHVTVWNTVPALMEMLVGYLLGRRERLPDRLRLVMMSGDWIPIPLPARIRGLATADIDLISLGGATEGSVWSIWHRITDVQPGWVSIPYGTPLANQQFEILDEALRRRPDWVPGEQYIGGHGVARGYWRDEDKTARSFITHPRTGQRLYRTGDLGRYFPDGSIEFLGREDFQIKIHGYRIELGEIEAALTSHDAVEAAVVTAIGKARGEKRLVAYVTRSHRRAAIDGADPADTELLVKAIREHLNGKLPSYMVPSHILVLDALPLTRNGKIDRSALPAPVTPRDRTQPAQPATEAAAGIADVWRSILNTDVGPDDDYFTLGATPAQAITAHHRIRYDLNLEVNLDSVFTQHTPRSLADTVTTAEPSHDVDQ